MKIILLRHGEPDIDTGVRLSANEYAGWLSVFNRASIKDAHLVDEALKQRLSQSNFVVCSDLSRSIDSAKALGFEQPDIIESLFREFETPYANWSWPGLSASGWTALFRIMWLLGYSANAESFREARQRAVMCMDRLSEYAKQHGTVLFVGHGSLLWYLARLLRKNGWQGPKLSPRQHWDYAIYSC